MVEEKASVEENHGITEDYCFCCKEGGDLLLCDYKGCLKAYHPKCVGKDDSILESAVQWTCSWHSCRRCHKSSKHQCFLCPVSYCELCIAYVDSEFTSVRRYKGFCRKCIWLAELIEKNVDVDSDGEHVNFDDRSSVEWLFKEYWLTRKEKENLTSEDVYSANCKLKKSKKHVFDYSSDLEQNEVEENEFNISDNDNDDGDDSYDLKEDEQSSKRKRSKGKQNVSKKKAKDKKEEFIGWASKSLVKFLSSIGKDTNEELSQYEVTTIITRYCEENKLFHPEKKKMILCDAMLQTLLGRKLVSKNKIYDRLETHFAENMEQFSDDEVKSSSEGEDVSLGVEKKRKSSMCKNSTKNEMVSAVRYSNFASIVPKNINFVYLRRSLVEKLLEQPETFDSKVVGSFVRVKVDPNDISQKNPYMIAQVKGIKKTSCSGDIKSSVLLQVSNMLKDLPICKLLDDDISEEECKDLYQKMEQGLLKRPTVVELQEKVKSLHEDITKHWIARELALLRNRIDRANERGKRRELYEYLDRKKLLETPSEQARMLEEVPEVVAEVLEPEPSFEDSLGKDKEENNNGSAEVAIGTPKTHNYRFKENWASCWANGGTNMNGGTNATGEKQQQSEECLSEMSSSNHQVLAPGTENEHPIQRDLSQSFLEAAKQEESSKTSLPGNFPEKSTSATEGQACAGVPRRQQSHSDMHDHQAATEGQACAGVPRRQQSHSDMHDHQAAVQKLASQAEVIDLSDDDGDTRAPITKQEFEDSKWNIVSPDGLLKRGPLPLPVLKRWREMGTSDLKWKVWKVSQSQDKAIFLDDVLRHTFPGK